LNTQDFHSAVVPTAPAIANALADAVGIRILEMPLTAEKVFFSIQECEEEE